MCVGGHVADIEAIPTSGLIEDTFDDSEDTSYMPLPIVNAKSVMRCQQPKQSWMRLILLSLICGTIYWTSFFWLALVDTLRCYAAGNGIYDFIHLEKPEMGNETIEIPRIIHRMWPNNEFLKQENLEITRNFNHCIDLYKEKFTTILWTDESIRKWLQTHYPDFISTFDS